MILCAHSHWSLLRGTASPARLVARAAELGLRTLVLADDLSLAGAVEFWTAARAAGLRPVLGATIDGTAYLARDRRGYANLCRLISHRTGARPRAPESFEGLAALPPGRALHVYLADPREARLHRLLSAIRENTLFERVREAPPPALAPETLPETTPEEEELLESCDWEFLPAPRVFPSGQGGMERLRELVRAGLARRYPVSPPLERLERELGVIGRLGLADYFLVVHDIVRYARERGHPVAGRGSGASSLVAYLLGITNVDPVAYGLPFERFLHERRADFPDLDVDFSWRIRDEVIAHVFRRYGDVAMVSSPVVLRERSAFREAARALGYSDAQIGALRRGSGGGEDLRRIERAARALLGRPRHLSIHPGGVVLHPDGAAPLEVAEKGVAVTQYDKDAVEEAGLVKIDLLGNRALGAIREAGEIVARGGGTPPDPERPEPDPAAAALLREGRTLGCAQLESPAMRALLRMLRPEDVRGVMKALALIRPSAASLGMKDRFVRRARGLEAWEGSPADTYGILLYEDDAILVAAAAAGMEAAEADLFRRRVQKLRTEDERIELSREFLARAARHGTPPEEARHLWFQMARFNEFSFCRAHAASYALLAWAAARLRARHPAAFWTAALNNNQGLYDARVYVEEARRDGVRILPPCVQRSGVEFTEEGGAIRVGLGRVAGLGGREMEEILAGRPFASLADFLERTRMSRPSLRNLVLAGALDWAGGTRPEILLAALSGGVPAPPRPDFTEEEKFFHEFGILGLSVRGHPLRYLWRGPRPGPGSASLAARAGRRVRLAGLLATGRAARTARGEPMAFLTFEDEEGLFEAVLFPAAFRLRRVLGTPGPYVVTGTVQVRHDAVAVLVDRLERRASIAAGEVRVPPP
jgi:DNA polymerase-3 subunit alpha/error-prone DNA polymerase